MCFSSTIMTTIGIAVLYIIYIKLIYINLNVDLNIFSHIILIVAAFGNCCYSVFIGKRNPASESSILI